MTEYRVLSTTAILGYGFPLASFEAGMKKKPHVIAVDGGSTDPGPYYLGSGKSFTNRAAVKRDLEIMIKAGLAEKIPVIVGSAGGSGAESHLAWCEDIVREIASEGKLSFSMALIDAQLDKAHVTSELRAGRIRSLDAVPQLTEDDIMSSSRIVAQMGVEPFIKALAEKPDVILAGRAYDPCCFAAVGIINGFSPALCLHMGKILECAAICAIPGSGSDCMFGTVYSDHFTLEALNDVRKCTTTSVAAHTLYEKSDPFRLYGPGGHLDLTECAFKDEGGGTISVRGTKFVPSNPYTVKMEGARPVGFRTISIAGIRDPIAISEIDNIIDGVRTRVHDNFDGKIVHTLNFIVYGRDGVMGKLEPTRSTANAHELGIVIEATAATIEEAQTICSFARSTMLHYGYAGRRATAGNLAFPYSPSDLDMGEVYEFSIYHLLEVSDPNALFNVRHVQL